MKDQINSRDEDRSIECEQIILDMRIKSKVDMPLETNNSSGICLNCGEVTGTDKRWCNPLCRDEWSHYNG